MRNIVHFPYILQYPPECLCAISTTLTLSCTTRSAKSSWSVTIRFRKQDKTNSEASNIGGWVSMNGMSVKRLWRCFPPLVFRLCYYPLAFLIIQITLLDEFHVQSAHLQNCTWRHAYEYGKLCGNKEICRFPYATIPYLPCAETPFQRYHVTLGNAFGPLTANVQSIWEMVSTRVVIFNFPDIISQNI